MNVHIVFHTKSATPMRGTDLSRMHDYIGGLKAYNMQYDERYLEND